MNILTVSFVKDLYHKHISCPVLISVIIPTYNEKENVLKLVPRLHESLSKHDHEIILVDDNSPDGTGEVAEELTSRYPVVVIHREGKGGLSSAVIDGFAHAKGNILGVMDADLSHPPESVPDMIRPIIDKKAELVIGSRYVPSGGVKNWTSTRKLISKVATSIALPLTKVKDPMSGFFFFKREVIEDARLNAKGYKIGLELIVKGRYKNVLEVPYIFEDRKFGKSKLDYKEYMNYLSHAWNLYKYKNKGMFQMGKFFAVGGIGMLINLGLIYLFTEFIGWWYIHSAIVGILVSLSTNFIGNKFWAFANMDTKVKVVVKQYLYFALCSLPGIMLQIISLYGLVEFPKIWYINASVIAIIIASFFNFLLNKYWVFREIVPFKR